MTQQHSYTLNNGITMPALGLGVYQSSPEDTLTAVGSALATGYRLIDTAAIYGNERAVGQALAQAQSESAITRSDIFLTTKLWIHDFGRDAALRAFDASLQRLGLDYVDLYLLHWPVPTDFAQTIAAYQAAQALLSEGRVRAIGVSNFTSAHLAQLLQHVEVTPAVNQVELHPFFAQPALQATHQKLGIITQAWSPIGGINRYWSRNLGRTQDPLTHPVITALAQKYGKSAAQIIVRWHLEQGISAIPKSVNPGRSQENFEVFDFQLSSAEVQAICALNSDTRGGPDPDEVSPQLFKFQVQD